MVLKKDKLMKEFFDNNKDSSIELQQIKTDIENLQFKLSLDYTSIKKYLLNRIPTKNLLFKLSLECISINTSLLIIYMNEKNNIIRYVQNNII